MQICEWFNSSTIQIQNFISSPGEFYDIKIPKNYNNILSSVKKSDNNFDLQLFNQSFINNDKILYSHKYQIYFNDNQHKILKNYFEECKKKFKDD